MVTVGRAVVAHLRAGEDAIERLGGPLPWEIVRIRHGDYAPIVRRLEPAFEVGSRFVIATAYHRPQLVKERRDGRMEPTGEVIPARRRPTLTIEIAGLRRTAKGLWSVRFHVEDQRDPVRRLRRVPPAQELGEAHDFSKPLTGEEEETARLESAYGGSPKSEVDDQEAVDDQALGRFTAEAKAIEIVAEAAHNHRAAAERRRTKSLEQDLADALALAEQKGIDTSSVRFITERQIARLRRRLDRVA